MKLTLHILLKIYTGSNVIINNNKTTSIDKHSQREALQDYVVVYL